MKPNRTHQLEQLIHTQGTAADPTRRARAQFLRSLFQRRRRTATAPQPALKRVPSA
ncbi:hypothetical protein [Marinobacter sp. JSM 1782161]|uniref:hypothetical protein n=1 Tax=Marinobacter sp. JSM 1782161 TaxID=2685906 RepID=UPI001402F12F|nr:hypothetical protein [Marinobacter sp. JSM 1782161]